MRILPIAAVLTMILTAAAQAQSPASRLSTLSVSGHGHAEVAPEIAHLTAEITTRGASLDAAVAAHQENAAKALAALQGMADQGISIDRSTFRLDHVQPPQQQGQKQPPQEFHAVTTFALKASDLGKLDAAITAIAETGLLEISGLQFTVNDERKASNLARVDAVSDAKSQAQALADAAGVQLAGIVEMSGDGNRVFAAAPMQMMKRSVAVVPPSGIAFDATVSMTWRISPKP